MNWMCDVYVYEDVNGGWTTHIAGARRLFPPIPAISFTLLPKFGGRLDQDRMRVVYSSAWRESAAKLVHRFWCFWHKYLHLASGRLSPRIKIKLPHAGGMFNDDTPGECAERLLYLRSLGYKVPQYAIDSLMEEENERRNKTP